MRCADGMLSINMFSAYAKRLIAHVSRTSCVTPQVANLPAVWFMSSPNAPPLCGLHLIDVQEQTCCAGLQVTCCRPLIRCQSALPVTYCKATNIRSLLVARRQRAVTTVLQVYLVRVVSGSPAGPASALGACLNSATLGCSNALLACHVALPWWEHEILRHCCISRCCPPRTMCLKPVKRYSRLTQNGR